MFFHHNGLIIFLPIYAVNVQTFIYIYYLVIYINNYRHGLLYTPAPTRETGSYFF